VRLQSYHEGTTQVKTRLYETYRREFENFTQLDGESIDAMFSRFQTIVNKMRANKAQLPYDDHEMALKLLYVLDQKVWDVKVTAIIESPGYETLTVDELFSKLKSTEIDYQTQAKLKNPSTLTMALVSGNGSSSLANPSQMSFALSSLVFVTEEQLEALGNDELALIISWFSWFHNNRLNYRRGGPKDATAVEIPTTSSPIALRITSTPLTSTTPVSARTSASTPPSTSRREDSTRRC
jgi:hypothetical protein